MSDETTPERPTFGGLPVQTPEQVADQVWDMLAAPEPQVSGALPTLPEKKLFGVSRFGSIFYGYDEQAMQAYAKAMAAMLMADRDRLLSALRKLVNEPQDITSKAYQHALGVLGEFEG